MPSKDFNSHAHVERDCSPCGFQDFSFHFNSHAHVERDHSILISQRKIEISTHTLTWSVTSVKGNEHAHTLHFNSHAHVERD